jgi:hypothetical protein
MTTFVAAESGDTLAVVARGPEVHGAAREAVLLKVNLAPRVANALTQTCRDQGIPITEGIRRAIAIWKFLVESRREGKRLGIVETTPTGRIIRELEVW